MLGLLAVSKPSTRDQLETHCAVTHAHLLDDSLLLGKLLVVRDGRCQCHFSQTPNQWPAAPTVAIHILADTACFIRLHTDGICTEYSQMVSRKHCMCDIQITCDEQYKRPCCFNAAACRQSPVLRGCTFELRPRSQHANACLGVGGFCCVCLVWASTWF